MKRLSKNQIAIMKHTVGEHGRNWFGTSKGCTDANDFDELVGLGLATSAPAPEWSGDNVVYYLTGEGRARVDSEEFGG